MESDDFIYYSLSVHLQVKAARNGLIILNEELMKGHDSTVVLWPCQLYVLSLSCFYTEFMVNSQPKVLFNNNNNSLFFLVCCATTCHEKYKHHNEHFTVILIFFMRKGTSVT